MAQKKKKKDIGLIIRQDEREEFVIDNRKKEAWDELNFQNDHTRLPSFN